MSRLQEFHHVMNSIKMAWKRKQRPALLMLIDVHGSAYRLPGTKMLMVEDGEMVGSISGGCLESDLFTWAEKAIKTGTPLIKNYDLSDNEIWSLGIGCKGSLEICILPIDDDDPYWEKTDELLNEDKAFSLILEVPTGIKILVNEKGEVIGDTVGLPHEVYERALVCLDKQRRAEVMELNGHRYVIDVIRPSQRLIVAGAGKDAIPVVDLAAKAGFSVTVLDPRNEFNNQRLFPKAEHLVKNPESIDPYDVADCWWVIMNHLQNRDEGVLELAINSSPQYVGVLGPLSRTQEMLLNIGQNLSSCDFIHSPVGLDLGAETMEEVAISIVSELMAVRSKRSGTSLKGTVKIHA